MHRGDVIIAYLYNLVQNFIRDLLQDKSLRKEMKVHVNIRRYARDNPNAIGIYTSVYRNGEPELHYTNTFIDAKDRDVR